MTLYVDPREPNDIIELIKSKLSDVEVKMLISGDYTCLDFGAERKHLTDLLSSISDGRYWNQIKTLKENFSHPVIILEGDIYNTMKSYRMGNKLYHKKLDDKDRKVIRGIELSTLINWGIPVIKTSGKEDTVNTIIDIYDRVTRDKKNYIPRAIVKKSKSVDEIRLNCLQCVEGVGPMIASRVFEQFSWDDIVSMADSSSLMSVKGMTDVVAKRLIEVF